jgi:hypothetical protein
MQEATYDSDGNDGQTDTECQRCGEVDCVCNYLPASWREGAHPAYLTYAKQQHALKE